MKKQSLGFTVDGKPRTRRPAAVGAERDRLTKAAINAIKSAGVRGLSRDNLAAIISAGRTGTGQIIDALREDRRIHITAWRFGKPADGIGDKPDVLRPVPGAAPPSSKKPEPDFEAIAEKEIRDSHAAWKWGWVPHCDVAAAWMMGCPA